MDQSGPQVYGKPRQEKLTVVTALAKKITEKEGDLTALESKKIERGITEKFIKELKEEKTGKVLSYEINVGKGNLAYIQNLLKGTNVSASFNEKTGSITISRVVSQQTQMKVTAVSPPEKVGAAPAKEVEQTAEQKAMSEVLALCRSNETSDNMKAEKAFEEITGNKDPAYKKALKGETKDASGKPATYRERMEMALKWAVKKNPDIKAADEYSELYTKLKKQLGNDVQLDLGAVSKFETLYGSLSNLDLGLDKTKWIGSKIGHTELDVKGWHKEILALNQRVAAKKAAEGAKAKEKTAGTVKKKTEAKSVAQVEDSLSLRIEEFKTLKDKEAKKLVKRLEKIPKEPADRRNEIYESIKRNEDLWKKNGFKGYAKDPDAVYLRMVGRILDGYGVPK